MAEHQVRIVLALHRKNEQRRRRFSFLEVDADHHIRKFARRMPPAGGSTQARCTSQLIKRDYL